jgi:hypothetical protein
VQARAVSLLLKDCAVSSLFPIRLHCLVYERVSNTSSRSHWIKNCFQLYIILSIIRFFFELCSLQVYHAHLAELEYLPCDE